MDPRGLDRQIAGVAALEEPARRALYDFVVRRARAVSREEAARGVRVSRALAAFHLDKLVDAGLLATEYRRLTGRTGPGAGRPAKLYRRADVQVAVSLPPRSYALVAELFAAALDRAEPAMTRALRTIARDCGRRMAERAGPARGGRGAPQAALGAAAAVLEPLGFEPALEGGELRLRNCPFHALAVGHRALVCGANLALVQGLLGGLGAPSLEAVLDPRPGMCCVALRPRARGRRRRP